MCFLFIFVLRYFRAAVEIKPLLYAADGTECDFDIDEGDISIDTTPNYWGFYHEHWHDFCFQKCVVRGKICAAVLSVTNELAMKIFSEYTDADQDGVVHQNCIGASQMDRVARFCIFCVDKILLKNHFSWGEVMVSYFLLKILCL